MQEEVIFQVGVFAETARTDVAFERPRPAVHVHVRFQISGSRERLGTKCALVRLFLFIFSTFSKKRRTKKNQLRQPISL